MIPPTFDWKSCKDEIPKLNKGIVSVPVLFIVEDKVYAGHYHMNGFFYNDNRRGKGDLFLAVGNEYAAYRLTSRREKDYYQRASYWTYLN